MSNPDRRPSVQPIETQTHQDTSVTASRGLVDKSLIRLATTVNGASALYSAKIAHRNLEDSHSYADVARSLAGRHPQGLSELMEALASGSKATAVAYGINATLFGGIAGYMGLKDVLASRREKRLRRLNKK